MILGFERTSEGAFMVKAAVDGHYVQIGRNHKRVETAIEAAKRYIEEHKWTGYVMVRNRNTDWHMRVTA
jgi:hypothetical protein